MTPKVFSLGNTLGYCIFFECVLIRLVKNQPTSNTAKTLITILFLIFAAPIGFLFMIFWAKWNIWVKILVSVFYVPLATIGFVSFMLAAIKG